MHDNESSFEVGELAMLNRGAPRDQDLVMCCVIRVGRHLVVELEDGRHFLVDTKRLPHVLHKLDIEEETST